MKNTLPSGTEQSPRERATNYWSAFLREEEIMRILARERFQKSKSQSSFKCSNFKIFKHSLGHKFLMLLSQKREIARFPQSTL